jgi:predicted nucleotide-binding protein
VLQDRQHSGEPEWDRKCIDLSESKYNELVFYHARVTCKPARAKEAALVGYEYDLSREDLLCKIAIPFIRKEQFFCGGVIIIPDQVAELKFGETQQSSEELAPFIAARWRMSGVVIFSPPQQAVVSEGKDVTRAILDEANAKQNGGEPKPGPVVRSDRVFIVHGHDQRAVDQTEILVRRFGLTPIILSNQPNQGNTVIEKFEAHSKVGLAIVLLTPDDLGCVAAKAPGALQARARQNVIWEWGYLVAKLGRPNVICLYKTGVELPSDLHGLVTINIDDDVRDNAEEIRREMIAAGYNIP